MGRRQDIVVALEEASEFVVLQATTLYFSDAREVRGIRVGVGLCAPHSDFAAPADFKFGEPRILRNWDQNTVGLVERHGWPLGHQESRECASLLGRVVLVHGLSKLL